MNSINLGTWYTLSLPSNGYKIVMPFDGEIIGQAGISHGFVHYISIDGEKGFCGISYFENNSEIYDSRANG